MNKAILQNYLQTEPNDAKEKYIFLIDDKNAALAIISAGFKAAALIKEEGFFAVEEFISYLKEKSFIGLQRKTVERISCVLYGCITC